MTIKLAQSIPSGFSLLNTGGTSLTANSTITINNIGGYETYFIRVASASSVNASAAFGIRINGDSTSSYNYALAGISGTAAYGTYSQDTSIAIGRMGNSASNNVNAYLFIHGASGAVPMPFHGNGSGNGSTDNLSYGITGIYDPTTDVPLSSISIISSTGNFDAGTIYVYAK